MTSITLEQIITFLLETPMFGDLDAAELSQIVHIMQLQRVREGQPIFREGDPGDAWYVIYEGGAEVHKSTDFLPARRIATLSPRSCFGEMAILDHSPRSASVVALAERCSYDQAHARQILCADVWNCGRGFSPPPLFQECNKQKNLKIHDEEKKNIDRKCQKIIHFLFKPCFGCERFRPIIIPKEL